MTTEELKKHLLDYIKPSYPNIHIDVIDKEDSTRHIYFTEEKFKLLYPQQRFHYLIHKIPNDFYDNYISGTTWYELAPGEEPGNLDYHDSATIESIKEMILEILKNKTCFVKDLDNLFLTNQAVCHGDFRHSKKLLTDFEFTEKEQFDIFHVLMSEGGYCDCEILYNAFKDSGYANKYWSERNK